VVDKKSQRVDQRRVWPPKLAHHGEVVVPFCSCGMAIVLYDTQVVQCNAPTTPQPCETFLQYIVMIKCYPVLGKHSGIFSSLRRLFRRGEQLMRDENKVLILGGNIWGFGDASALLCLIINLAFKVFCLCTPQK
jgi:hypothetical protein